MTRGKALIAGALFPLLLIAVAVVLYLPTGKGDGRLVRAEMQNAALLVPGHDVRVDGTTVGEASDVELTDRGTVLVTMRLAPGAPAVKADATASVRATDVLGDVHIGLEPGRSARPLEGAIRSSRTFQATRVQDAFDIFDGPTRIALQSILVELGRALEARGVDLNGAVLGLAPVLESTERVAQQLSSQDAQLERLLVSARRLTSRLAPRSQDIERLIAGFDATFSVLRSRSGDLDRGLAGLPATLTQARRSLVTLDRSARATLPLARDLRAIAPPLTEAIAATGPFVRQARPALAQTRPVVREATRTLQGARRSLPRLESALQATRAAAPSINAYFDLVGPLLKYFVGGSLRSLGGVASEPGAAKAGGTQISDQPHRNFFRVMVTYGCEMFGVETRPGCLADALDVATGPVRRRRSADRDTASRTTAKDTPSAPPADSPSRAPRLPAVPALPKLPALPALPALPKAPKVPDEVQDAVRDAAGQAQDPAGGAPPAPEAAGDALDYLLGP